MMATSLQERLKLKQYQVDTWTTREQLCLASAVMRSGDQNWVAVRRNIKMLTNETSRPPDWYSTKNCALQYAKLLERVDTPKRKRERGDGVNETPGEIVTKMLSKQRIEELRALETEERATYNHLRREIQQLDAGLLDQQLDTLWEQLVKEHAEEEEEERQHQQWLKEREEKITAIQQALKHQGPKAPVPPHKRKPKSQTSGGGQAASRRNSGLSETSSEVDSALDSPDLSEAASENLVSNKSQDEGGSQETESKPTPTSPLLSSLLSKSPITNVPITSVPGSSSSPLNLIGLGSRGIRGMGISPVSEALQNLVSSAISGTDSVDKDKSSHISPASGSSTLSLLLDLPPSTPGGPLPRLSDLPGPRYERKDPEKRINLIKKFDKEAENEAKAKGCEEATALASKTTVNTPEQTVKKVGALMEVEGEDRGGEGEEIKEEAQMEEEKSEEAREDIMEDVDKLVIGKNEINDIETEDTKQENQQTQIVEEKPEESTLKESKSQVTQEINAGILKKDLKKVNEKVEKTADAEDEAKLEDKNQKYEDDDKEKNGNKDEDIKHFENSTSFKCDDKDLKEENLSTCDSVRNEDCKKPELDCKKTEQEKHVEMGNLVICKEKQEDEDDLDSKRKTSADESLIKLQKNDDTEQDIELEKKFHKKDQEEED
ncbi:hypothetical protein OTU49_004644, partial [Cherax quadricarinatus]